MLLGFDLFKGSINKLAHSASHEPSVSTFLSFKLNRLLFMLLDFFAFSQITAQLLHLFVCVVYDLC